MRREKEEAAVTSGLSRPNTLVLVSGALGSGKSAIMRRVFAGVFGLRYFVARRGGKSGLTMRQRPPGIVSGSRRANGETSSQISSHR